MTKSLDAESARLAFETALRDYRPGFETFFLARLYGLEFSYVDAACIIRFPVHDFMFNPQGSLHGGVIAFVLDVSMGHLLRHTLGVPGTTIEMKTQYFAPVRGRRPVARRVFCTKGGARIFWRQSCLTPTESWRRRPPPRGACENPRRPKNDPPADPKKYC